LPVEYQSLAILTLFFMLAWLPVSVGKKQAFGLKWLASNRDQSPKRELQLWAQRCDRAFNNLKDNFPAFAITILLLGVLDKFDHWTIYAAVAYVVARLLHYLAYGFGFFLARFLSFAVAFGANLYLLIKVLI
jgi:uncharacterized MAPEG superfamily protein